MVMYIYIILYIYTGLLDHIYINTTIKPVLTRVASNPGPLTGAVKNNSWWPVGKIPTQGWDSDDWTVTGPSNNKVFGGQ